MLFFLSLEYYPVFHPLPLPVEKKLNETARKCCESRIIVAWKKGIISGDKFGKKSVAIFHNTKKSECCKSIKVSEWKKLHAKIVDLSHHSLQISVKLNGLWNMFCIWRCSLYVTDVANLYRFIECRLKHASHEGILNVLITLLRLLIFNANFRKTPGFTTRK